MITDPKTVPAGRVGRVVFGAARGGRQHAAAWRRRPTSSAPRSACSPGLVVDVRGPAALDRLVPEPKSEADDLRAFADASRDRASARAPAWARARAVVAALVVLVIGAGIVARRHARRAGSSPPGRTEVAQPRSRDRSTRPRCRRSPSARTSSTSTTSSPGPGCRRSWSRWRRTWSSRTRRCCAATHRS